MKRWIVYLLHVHAWTLRAGGLGLMFFLLSSTLLMGQTALQRQILRAQLAGVQTTEALLDSLDRTNYAWTDADSLYLIGGRYLLRPHLNYTEAQRAQDVQTFHRLYERSGRPEDQNHALLKLWVGYRHLHPEDDHVVDTSGIWIQRYDDHICAELIYGVEFGEMWRIFYRADYQSALDYIHNSQGWKDVDDLPLRWKVRIHNARAVFFNSNLQSDSSLAAYEYTLELMAQEDTDSASIGRVNVLNNYAFAVMTSKDYERALVLYQDLLELLDCTIHTQNCMFAYIDLAFIYRNLLQYQLSDAFMDRALDHSYAYLDRSDPEWFTLYEAIIGHHQFRSEHGEAARYFDELVEWSATSGVTRDRGANYALLLTMGAEIDVARGEDALALSNIEEARRILIDEYVIDGQPMRPYLRALYPISVEVYAANDQFDSALEACDYFDRAVTAYPDMSVLAYRMKIARAEVLMQMNRYTDAYQVLRDMDMDRLGYGLGASAVQELRADRWTLMIRAIERIDSDDVDQRRQVEFVLSQAWKDMSEGLLSVLTKYDQHRVYSQYQDLYDEIYETLLRQPEHTSIGDLLLTLIDRKDQLSYQQDLLKSSYEKTAQMTERDARAYEDVVRKVQALEAAVVGAEGPDARARASADLMLAYDEFTALLKRPSIYRIWSQTSVEEGMTSYEKVRTALQRQRAGLILLWSRAEGWAIHYVDHTGMKTVLINDTTRAAMADPHVLEAASISGFDLGAMGYGAISDALNEVLQDSTLERMYIMASPAALGIPFEALEVSGRMMIDLYNISYIHHLGQISPVSDDRASAEMVMMAPVFDQPELIEASSAHGGHSRALLPQPNVYLLAQHMRSQISGAYYLRQEATLRRLQEQLSTEDILHISSHIQLDQERPLQSELKLALEDGRPRDMKYYQLLHQKMYAPLVVLHACEAGSAMNTMGYGAVSLARTLSVSGCGSLITSVWSIDEQQSSKILERFYDHLQDVALPSEALRRAKLDYLAEAQGVLRHPYYWAGLVYVGHDAPIQLNQAHGMSSMVWMWVVSGLLITTAFIWWRIKRSV